MLDFKIASNALSYDPKTGLISRLHGRHIGDAGSAHNLGYRRIKIRGRSYLSHRIAWLLYYGEWPKCQIDHINGIKDDNRISNLRICTDQQNKFNQRLKKNNKSGFKGVCLYKRTNRWIARIKINGIQKHLGYFDTPKLASEAYESAAKKSHGEFYRAS